MLCECQKAAAVNASNTDKGSVWTGALLKIAGEGIKANFCVGQYDALGPIH